MPTESKRDEAGKGERMRTAGEIVHKGGSDWKGVDIFIYDGGSASVGAIVQDPAFGVGGAPPMRQRLVSWPSIGSVSPAEARAFADAIRAAADWAETAELEVANAS